MVKSSTQENKVIDDCKESKVGLNGHVYKYVLKSDFWVTQCVKYAAVLCPDYTVTV